MSQENVDRLRGATEAFNRWAAAPSSDPSGFLGFLDPAIKFEPVQARLQGTPYVRLDGVAAWLADLAEHYEVGRVDYVEIRDLGDRVLGLGTLRVTGDSSGIDIEVPMAVLASFRDGLMTRFKDYGDKDQALEAAGLLE